LQLKTDAAVDATAAHRSVLYKETLEVLAPRRGGRYVDGTLGAGGHAAGILLASSPSGELLGLDLDPEALALATLRLAEFGERAKVRRGSYGQLSQWLADAGWVTVDGVLLDLGASSMQFDRPQRGFSFKDDGPLDMRFDPQGSTSAADLVNELPEDELADIIRRYGEEPRARAIAKSIAKERPVKSTKQLADIVAKAARKRKGAIHPATQTFQALRIAVNAELATLEAALPQAVAALGTGGRLAVISFHSLEDRIVKQFMRRESQDCICPPQQPVCTCGHKASIKEVTRKPIRPAEEETELNPRARSARLRVAEKL
jgi:16S rRNA (cytosine1402-N4)-methyltransferase